MIGGELGGLSTPADFTGAGGVSLSNLMFQRGLRATSGGVTKPNYVAGIGNGGGNGLIVLSYNVVPEPGTLGLVSVSAAMFLLRRRQR